MEAELDFDYSNYIGVFKPPTSDFTFTPRFEDKEDEEWNQRLERRIAEGYKPPVIIDAYEDTESSLKDYLRMLEAENEQIRNGTHPCFPAPPPPATPHRTLSSLNSFLAGELDVDSPPRAPSWSSRVSSSPTPSDDMDLDLEGSDDEDTEVGLSSSPAPSSPSSTLVDMKDESSPSPTPSKALQAQKGAKKRVTLHKNVDGDYSENDVESDPEDEGSPSKKARRTGPKPVTARKVTQISPRKQSAWEDESDRTVPLGPFEPSRIYGAPGATIGGSISNNLLGGKSSIDGITRTHPGPHHACHACGQDTGKVPRRHFLDHSGHIGGWSKQFYFTGEVHDERNPSALLQMTMAMVYDTMRADSKGRALVAWTEEEEQARVEFLDRYAHLTELTPDIGKSFVVPEALRQRLRKWVGRLIAERTCTKPGCSQILARKSALQRHLAICHGSKKH